MGRADGCEVPSSAASGAVQVWFGDQALVDPLTERITVR